LDTGIILVEIFISKNGYRGDLYGDFRMATYRHIHSCYERP